MSAGFEEVHDIFGLKIIIENGRHMLKNVD